MSLTMKGTHGLQQQGLVFFTAGLALCTPASWLFQDWYNGELTGPTSIFKIWFASIHLFCGIMAIIGSIKINDKIDKELKK